MANFVVALGYNTTATPLHVTRKDVNLSYMIDRVVDFSSTAVTASTYQNNYYTSLSGVVSGDTVDVLPIPTKSLVKWVGMEIVRAATGNTDGTFQVSLVAPSTVMIAATSAASTGIVLSSVTFLGSSAATAYSGASAVLVTSANGTNVRVTVGTSVPDAQIRVFAIMHDISSVSVGGRTN